MAAKVCRGGMQKRPVPALGSGVGVEGESAYLKAINCIYADVFCPSLNVLEE